MRYIFVINSKAGAAQSGFVERLLHSNFPEQGNVLLAE